jgi:small nuclear ribonucleoprotein (snRNP)-like protein
MTDFNNNKNVFKNSPKDSGPIQDRKPLRYSKDSFVKELIGKNIQIELVNGKILTGKLVDLGMFDILLELKSTESFNVSGKTMSRDVVRRIIILKSAIISVEVK